MAKPRDPDAKRIEAAIKEVERKSISDESHRNTRRAARSEAARKVVARNPYVP